MGVPSPPPGLEHRRVTKVPGEISGGWVGAYLHPGWSQTVARNCGSKSSSRRWQHQQRMILLVKYEISLKKQIYWRDWRERANCLAIPSPAYPRPQLPLVCFSGFKGNRGSWVISFKAFVLKENSVFPTECIGFPVPSKHDLTDATLQENRVSYFSSSQYLSWLKLNNRQFCDLPDERNNDDMPHHDLEISFILWFWCNGETALFWLRFRNSLSRKWAF